MTMGNCILSRLMQAWFGTGGLRTPRRRRIHVSRIELLEFRALLAADLNLALVLAAVPDIGSADRFAETSIDKPVTGDDEPDIPVEFPVISGVTFPSMWRVGQLNGNIVISLAQVPTDTRIDLSIDWNGDGNFSGASESIARHMAITDEETGLTVDVPSFATSGTLLARLWLTSAESGAVQTDDFEFLLVPPNYPSGEFGLARVIDSSSAVQFTSAADLDRDGDMDLLSATFSGSGVIAWYSNDGDQNFTRHVISDTSTDATSVIVADMNSDGYLDVIASSLGNDTIIWYENDGLQQFTSHTVTNTAFKASSLFVADVNRDGALDIVAASKGDNLITWYENTGTQEFVRHVVTNAVDAPCAVFAADMNGDGQLDLVSASFVDNKIAWYQNDGRQIFTQQVITTSAGGVRGMYVVDLDADGDQDIVASCLNDNSILWFENNGHGVFSRYSISLTASGASAVSVADMDGDGDLDILGASRGNTTAAWFENTGSFDFPQHTITKSNLQARGIIAADVDGDGDLDVVSATKDGNRLAWFENGPAPFNATMDSPSPAVTDLPAIPVTLKFNRPASKLTLENLSVENGMIDNFTEHDSVYSFDVIPNQEGKITVGLAEKSVSDAYEIGNSAAVLTREWTLEQPVLAVPAKVVTYLRNGQPIPIVNEVTVAGSRVGGGTLVLLFTSLRPRWSQFDVVDDSALDSLGILTRSTKGDKRVTSIKLNSTTTADAVQTALRSLTFTSSKLGVKIKTREMTIQLVDNSEQSKSTISQTIEIPTRLEIQRRLQSPGRRWLVRSLENGRSGEMDLG